MKVFEISILVFLTKDINLRDSFSKIGEFIDSGMAKKTELLELENRILLQLILLQLFLFVQFPIEMQILKK